VRKRSGEAVEKEMFRAAELIKVDRKLIVLQPSILFYNLTNQETGLQVLLTSG